ncbi:uncharacterized protein LOC132705582 isoform X2 [Cylas formicarius]|uniref:uncharacterized protein LOC132705582 isoform X2 n=1 Tax=Cylas formicarius TaxID=197179 RepID=UPI002958D09A|nr:uncharacterized protein LOC132705582 isoform X2 [Cylas formicarius]
MNISNSELIVILERIVQPNAPQVDENFLSTLLQLVTGPEFDTRQSLDWIANTVKLWKETASPESIIFVFTLHFTEFLSKSESNFRQLIKSNVIKSLLKMGKSMSDNAEVTVSIMGMIKSFCEHNAGIIFVKDSGLWLDIISKLQSENAKDPEFVKIGFDLIATLLTNAAEEHITFSTQVLKLVADPLIDAMQLIEGAQSEDSISTLIPNIVSMIEILERLLEKVSLNVLKALLTLELEKVCENWLSVSTNEKLCLDLGRIAIILSFYRIVYYFDGIKVVNRDGVTLECFLRIFENQITKGHVKTAFKLCFYTQKYWKSVEERMPKYYRKGKPIEVEDQIMAILMVPLVKFIKTVNSSSHKSYGYEEETRLIYLFSVLGKVSVNTYYSAIILFNFLGNFPIFEIEYLVLDCFIECKHYFSRQNAGLIFQMLMYVIKEFLFEYINTKAPRNEISSKPLRFVTRLLDALLEYIVFFNLSWTDSVTTIFGIYLAVGFLKFNLWPPELIIKGLILLDIALKKNMSANMTLLIDSTNNSPLTKIGPTLRLKCCNENWEIRKATLEVVHTVALKASNMSNKSQEKFPSFQTILQESHIVELVFNMALNDSNIFVRAKAMECIKKMMTIEDIARNLLENNCLEKILKVLFKEEELVRKEAVGVITKIYKYHNTSEYNTLQIYNAMEYVASVDHSPGVIINGLKFWKNVIFKHLENQGMTDKIFPDVTFSKEEKKIVILTKGKVKKRLVTVLNQLSSTGCFALFINHVKQTPMSVNLLSPALKTLQQLSEILKRYEVGKEDIKCISGLHSYISRDLNEINHLVEELINNTNIDILKDLENMAHNQYFLSQLENEVDLSKDHVSPEDFIEFLYNDLPFYILKSIWADDSDNEDDNKSFNKPRKSKNYSAPIGFVAGGVQQAGKKKNEIRTEKEESDEEKPSTSFKHRNSSDSEDEQTVGFGFGSQPKKPIQSTVTEITSDIAGCRTRNRVDKALINQGMGNWEKHTKGIGAKLLLQMGFQPGKGLGKDLQGISTPVEAHLRKGRGAIGAYGPEKPASIPKVKKKEVKDEIESDEETQGTAKWKRNDVSSKQKTRYYYRSVDDVIEKGKKPGGYRNSGISSDLSKVKVIDMTGPQQRILSGYHALSGLKAPPGVEHFEDVVHKKCQNFALPEIQHNLDLLVDMCEQDIIRIDRDLRYNHDKIVSFKHEEDSLKNQLLVEDRAVNNLRSILDIVDKLMDPSQDYSLGQIGSIFKDLLEHHYEEYCRYELGELAPGLVGPLLTSALANWNPLLQPKQYTEFYGHWKELLEEPKRRGTFEGNKVGIQPYDSLIWHTWVPVMRTCISSWNPRDCDPLINLMESWKPLLPVWILNNVFDQFIMPRISSEVNQWNPLMDTIPIHLWIHPWIPLLDDRLQEKVYPIIQEKLGVALTNWHPSDRSAKLMLQPWQRVLTKGAFLAFLLKHIVPKLQVCMQTMVINPHQQLLDPWNWVMDWGDMLSLSNMTLILDKFFFPRWLQTLAMWLNHNPNYNQVTEWYLGWKRMVSKNLLMQPTIKDSFHKALEMMSRAINIIQQPGAKESIMYLTNSEMNSAPPPPPPQIESIAEAVRTASKIPQGFKDLVTKRCEERGIIFVPIPNKYREAKQVYKIGSGGLQCYIDRNVIFYSQNNATWLPTSLNKLLDMAA